MKKLTVFSGGLDSTILLYDNVRMFGKENNYAISFDYGQKHAIELELAKKTAIELGVHHEIVDMRFLGVFLKDSCSLIDDSKLENETAEELEMNKTMNSYVPVRNQILLSIAASYAVANNILDIYTGIQKHVAYEYSDCSEDFLESVNECLVIQGLNVNIIAPFINMTKADEVHLAVKYNLTDAFKNSISCYNGVIGGCGNCGACIEREEAFDIAGVVDQ